MKTINNTPNKQARWYDRWARFLISRWDYIIRWWEDKHQSTSWVFEWYGQRLG
jgi:hypothetical protein